MATDTPGYQPGAGSGHLLIALLNPSLHFGKLSQSIYCLEENQHRQIMQEKCREKELNNTRAGVYFLTKIWLLLKRHCFTALQGQKLWAYELSEEKTINAELKFRTGFLPLFGCPTATSLLGKSFVAGGRFCYFCPFPPGWFLNWVPVWSPVLPADCHLGEARPLHK